LKSVNISELRAKHESTNVQMEAFKGKSNEIEALMSKKDQIILEQRQTIENNKASHKTQLEVIINLISNHFSDLIIF